MKTSSFVVYLSIAEVARLLNVPTEIIDKLCRAGIHPEWFWLPSMKAPSFHPDTLSQWARIVDKIDVGNLPDDLPPLQRPDELFGKEPAGPTVEELVVAAQVLRRQRHR